MRRGIFVYFDPNVVNISKFAYQQTKLKVVRYRKGKKC